MVLTTNSVIGKFANNKQTIRHENKQTTINGSACAIGYDIQFNCAGKEIGNQNGYSP
jgi:hypothetical protein